MVTNISKRLSRDSKNNHHFNYIHKKSVMIGLIFALSLILRLAHFTDMKHNNPISDIPIVDSGEYIKTAEYILNKNFFGTPTASYWHPPLYYYFIAIIYKIAGKSLDAIKLLQILMDSLNVLMVLFIAKIIFDRTVAIFSALLYAIYLPLVYYSSEILPPILMITLLLFSTVSLLKFTQKTKNENVNV
ncbi:MAG: glycosyltransferase family 39 protein, partial [candidate division WOR-3 bacterium]